MGIFQPHARHYGSFNERKLSTMAGKLFVTLDDINLAGKRALVRVDFNVPMRNGEIADDSRIKASLPTINKILKAEGIVILMSHMGQPNEGQFEPGLSLRPVANYLAELLGKEVEFCTDWLEGKDFPAQRKVILLENVRFLPGEKSNDDKLARKMARLCDVYVNDAFSAAHRIQASTHGVAKYSPAACAGLLLVDEMEALTKAFKQPAKPMTAIVGGSKVSSKLGVLKSLLDKVDHLIVGGGIANTFIKAAGYNVGKSLVENDLVDEAAKLMKNTAKNGKSIPLPVDVVCGKAFSEDATGTTKAIGSVMDDDLIMDIGPETAKLYSEILNETATIIWNGPLGVFEFEEFSNGTNVVANAIADSQAFSVAGGGDTLSAISKFHVADRISYITTAGGAFLEFLEGKTLPAIAILEECALAWCATEREC